MDKVEIARRVRACKDLIEKIHSGHQPEIRECSEAVGDSGDLSIHVYMALLPHTTSLGYAWSASREILNMPPVDDHHWFRRFEMTGQGQIVEVLIGGARMHAEIGLEARAMVGAALVDWVRRADLALERADEEVAA